MDNSVTSWLFFNTSANDSTHLKNHTETINPIYVFTPVGTTAKLVLCLILSAVGVVGFLGNCLVFYFLWQRKTKNPIKTSRFVTNLNLYIRSLSLSDLLSCCVSLPLICIQILFDVFQDGWACKIVRYLNFVFPALTINNLVVISLEKYLSTRKVPRTFSTSRVRKTIICAWVLGIIIMLIPAAAYDGKRVDLNDTHFTVICINNENFYPFKITFVIFPLQYILPGIFVTYVNIRLLKILWNRGNRRIGTGVSNSFRANLITMRIRGTSLLVALTFAFIIPYLFYAGNMVYNQIAKPQRAFATDFIIRYGGGGVAAYFSSAINFMIYFAQMKEFREFLKTLLCRKCCSGDVNTDLQSKVADVTTSRQNAGKNQVTATTSYKLDITKK
ncbi:adenosine receptor A3-like [Oculina patagonica]